jgi:hypothetical protein
MPSTLRPAALAALLLATPALAQPTVEDARLYLAFGAASSGAAYMVIRNPDGPDDRLLGASSPAARSVTLHGSEEENGVVRMTDLPGGLDLPAGGAVEMAPGGFHVMLMGLDGPLAPGDAVPLSLSFESGPVELSLPVEVQGPASAHGGHGGQETHDDHGGHGG